MAPAPDGNVKVTIQDPAFPDVSGIQILVPAARLRETQRGRPVIKTDVDR